jgi:hypothetical protein
MSYKNKTLTKSEANASIMRNKGCGNIMCSECPYTKKFGSGYLPGEHCTDNDVGYIGCETIYKHIRKIELLKQLKKL